MFIWSGGLRAIDSAVVRLPSKPTEEQHGRRGIDGKWVHVGTQGHPLVQIHTDLTAEDRKWSTTA